MASDGAQRKNQRRFLFGVCIILFFLGLSVWRFTSRLMHDVLFVADSRELGWILWMSAAAGFLTVVLSLVGCWGITKSNNWLYAYFVLVLLVLVLLTVAIKIVHQEVRTKLPMLFVS